MCVWGGGGGGGGGGQGAVCKLLFLMLFFSNSELNTRISQNLKEYLHEQHFLTRIFSYSILKVILCTSRRTQLQQKLEMSVSFLILS